MDVKDGLMMTTVDPSGIVMKNSLGNDTIIIDGSNAEIKFEDIHVDVTWFGPDLRGGENIDGGGWKS